MQDVKETKTLDEFKSALHLEEDEQLVCYGKVSSLKGTKGAAFLTSKRLIIHDEGWSNAAFVGLDNIKKVYHAQNTEGYRLEAVCVVFNDKPRSFFKAQPGISFCPRMEGDLAWPRAQIRLAGSWVTKIQNAAVEKEIADLRSSAFIKAWKCGYCETLNDAEKENCSHCGSPRRGEDDVSRARALPTRIRQQEEENLTEEQKDAMNDGTFVRE